MAERHLCSTEKVLKHDNGLTEKYEEIIDGYVAEGHACKLTPEHYSNKEAVVSTTSRCIEPQQAWQSMDGYGCQSKVQCVSK